MRAQRRRKLDEYLHTRRVYNTPWKDIFEVIDTDGRTRHRVVLTGPDTGFCACRRGRIMAAAEELEDSGVTVDIKQGCRHLALVLMRRGGLNGRGIVPVGIAV